MTESVFRLLSNDWKLIQKCILCNCMRLSDNQVVSVREQIKRILEEVFRSAIKSWFHTEKSNRKSILRWFYWIRNCSEIINLLTYALYLLITWILYMFGQLWQLNVGLKVWPAKFKQNLVFSLPVIECNQMKLVGHSIVLCHPIQAQ
jgi:hypothetical protein